MPFVTKLQKEFIVKIAELGTIKKASEAMGWTPAKGYMKVARLQPKHWEARDYINFLQAQAMRNPKIKRIFPSIPPKTKETDSSVESAEENNSTS